MREKHHFGDTFRETRKNPDKKIGVNRVGECTLNRKMASEKQSSPPEGAKGNRFFSFASSLGRENRKNEGFHSEYNEETYSLTVRCFFHTD